jgi:hypothetical protein
MKMNYFYVYTKTVVLYVATVTVLLLLASPELVGTFNAKADNAYDKVRVYSIPLCEGKM